MAYSDRLTEDGAEVVSSVEESIARKKEADERLRKAKIRFERR